MTNQERENQYVEAYRAYAEEILRYFFFRVYDRELARELTQEAFMKVWKYMVDGKDITHIKAFLYRVAYHIVVDHSRKKKEQSLDEMMESGFDVVSKELSKQDALDIHAVIHEMEQLGEKYREILFLRYMDGLSPKEIGTIMGLSENVVSVRIHRGIKQVQKKITI